MNFMMGFPVSSISFVIDMLRYKYQIAKGEKESLNLLKYMVDLYGRSNYSRA